MTAGIQIEREDSRADYTEIFQYDNLNRLTHATIGATTKTVTYNAVGNILTKTRLGSTSNNTYTYPAPGSAKPYAVSSITGTVNGVTNPSFIYDDNGNMETGPGRTMTWTSFNKVLTITQGAVSASYVYDAEHQRIKQTTGATTVKYFNDPASGVGAEHHYSGTSGVWHDYLFAEGRRIGMRVSTSIPAWQYYIHDHEDSVAVVIDGSGNVVQRLSYDAWGRRRQPNATEDPSGAITAPTSRGYTDHEHVDSFELINMNGRVYDPEVGRFLSADPIIPNLFRTQALNRYSYVYNNPLSLVDPSGYQVLDFPVGGGSSVKPYIPFTGYPYIDIPLNLFGGWLFGGDDDEPEPPQYHKPGIGSATENWRGDVPLRDVSAPLQMPAIARTVSELERAGYAEPIDAWGAAANAAGVVGTLPVLNVPATIVQMGVPATRGDVEGVLTVAPGLIPGEKLVGPLIGMGMGALRRVGGARIAGAVSRGMHSLPDDALVCRGGTCTAERFVSGSGVTLDASGRLQGVSVNSSAGKTIGELSAGIPNKQVGVTTVGEVRRAGGDVIPSPTQSNPDHCTLCDVTPQQAEQLMRPTIRNPNLR